jgi:hypothetical protein
MHLPIAPRLSMVFLLSALFMLLSGALSGVPSAAAATTVSGVEQVRVGTTDNSLSPKTIVAYCPAGKRIIGGGGEIDTVGSDRNPAFTELRPVFRIDGTRDAYVVTAAETPPGTTEEWELEAHAICANPLPGMFMIAYTTSPSSSSVQNSAVGCPWIIGAGARISTASGRVVLQAAIPFAPGSLARARGHEIPAGYSGTWTVTAYAICVPTKPAGYTIVVGHSSERMSEASKHASAQCPPDRKLLSVGGAITPTAPGHVSLANMLPSSSQRSDVYAVENTPTNLNWESIAATAICAY